MSEFMPGFSGDEVDLLKGILERDPYLSRPGLTFVPAEVSALDPYTEVPEGIPLYCFTRPVVRPESYPQYETK